MLLTYIGHAALLVIIPCNIFELLMQMAIVKHEGILLVPLGSFHSFLPQY